MKISKKYLDKHFKCVYKDNKFIEYQFTKKYHYRIRFNKNKNIVTVEDAPWLLLDTQEKLEMFTSLINQEWNL